MHPNPDFVYRDTKLSGEGGLSLLLKTDFFDTDKEAGIHKSHILGFLNLLDQIYWASGELVKSLWGPPVQKQRPSEPFCKVADPRASYLADRNIISRKIMVELGLWQF
jgi:hypothetical protein